MTDARQEDSPGQPAGRYARLRLASSEPAGVLALVAASRVGGWTPPLPPHGPQRKGLAAPIPPTPAI